MKDWTIRDSIRSHRRCALTSYGTRTSSKLTCPKVKKTMVMMILIIKQLSGKER